MKKKIPGQGSGKRNGGGAMTKERRRCEGGRDRMGA